MKTKLTILFLALIFVFAEVAFCDQLSQARALFYQGNTHYSEEDFVQAIADYEGTLTLGLESGPVYYNLANAYFKNGSLGKAILNYLRAERQMPRDADLESNLKFAQSLIKGGLVSPQRNWFMRIFFNLARSFNLGELSLSSSILYFTLAILLILAIVAKRLRKMLSLTIYPLLIVLIICLSLFFSQFYQTVIQRQAVVIVEITDSKFEPFGEATTYFSLNEGEAVFVGVAKKDWVKVRRLDDKQGWVKQSDIELL